MSKGSRGENELGYAFADRGFAWIRTAGSGTASRELPDITIGDGGSLAVFEVKRWSNKADYEYLSKQEVEDLIFFAEQFGAEYYIASRFDYKKWDFHKKEEMKETNKSYRIENVKNEERQRSIDEVCQELKTN
jgi:Holliday junction resolvase